MSDILWLPQSVTALDLIAAERRRQVEALGYSTQRDDAYALGELGRAAGAYIAAERQREWYGPVVVNRPLALATFCGWPWELESFKPAADSTPVARIRELTKAGALIVAEIERLQRLMAKEGAA